MVWIFFCCRIIVRRYGKINLLERQESAQMGKSNTGSVVPPNTQLTVPLTLTLAEANSLLVALANAINNIGPKRKGKGKGGKTGGAKGSAKGGAKKSK